MARLAQIYQLTEIEMSVTGVLLEFCVVAVLIYTWGEKNGEQLINRDRATATDLSAALPPLNPAHLKPKR